MRQPGVRFMGVFGRLSVVQFPRLRLGSVLIPLLVLILSGLPLLSAVRGNKSRSAMVKRTSVQKQRVKAPSKSSGKAQSKPAAKSRAKGSTSGQSASSSSGAKKGTLRAAPRSSKKGSTRAASRRAKPTIYRQQQPEPERIREIQQALTDRGYPIDVNGAWDASTVDALKRFQTDQKIENLSGKGKLDSMTLIALGLGPKREPLSGSTEAPKQTPEGR